MENEFRWNIQEFNANVLNILRKKGLFLMVTGIT